MARVRVKVCGITRPEDARAVAGEGVDALGLVFHPASPRAVTLEQALAIAGAVPPFVALVGLFVNPEPRQVGAALARLPLGWLQFHGDEEASFCETFERPYIKAIRVAPDTDVKMAAARHPRAAGILLDHHGGGQYGGTGQRFDWRQVSGPLKQPLVVAGGLNAGNVALAIRQLRPAAVDVSSGVESAPGIKDAMRTRKFMEAVNHARSSS